MRNGYRILVGNLKGRDFSEDLGMGEWITFKLISGDIGWEGVGRIHLVHARAG
jgi:hypothetical protein